MDLQEESVMFQTGQLLATPGVLNQIPSKEIWAALHRHLHGDWGDVCEADKQANNCALQCGERLFSAYHAGSRRKFWIITEADRSATTILLPEEY